MEFTQNELDMLAGREGRAVCKAMEILRALGTIYGAERLIPVTSVQIAGVSYDNLGEAGLQFLTEMAEGGGRARILATLNPAGMDVENWEELGIPADFAANQRCVLDAFDRMGVVTTCTCTPYLVGNAPGFGEHVAWAESSAVCYANSILGARTNREGGPSALAAALTGLTPEYGLHLDENRQPGVLVEVETEVAGTHQFGALGKAVGEKVQAKGKILLPYLRGIGKASLEELKSFCASLATYGGSGMFHMDGLTPEATQAKLPETKRVITGEDLKSAEASLSDATSNEVDFVSLGCPHLSIWEIARVADLLQGKKVRKEFWITTARPTRLMADELGYTQIIQESGAKIVADTCCVVAPIMGRFKAMACDSAKACYYASAKNKFKTVFRSFDEVVQEALG